MLVMYKDRTKMFCFLRNAKKNPNISSGNIITKLKIKLDEVYAAYICSSRNVRLIQTLNTHWLQLRQATALFRKHSLFEKERKGV